MSAIRPSRRAAAKKIDYSKEQEFSDEEGANVFEDSDDEPVAPKRKSAPRPRKSSGKAVTSTVSTPATHQAAMVAEEDDDDDSYPSKPQFSEKGYDPSLLPIRERFPFLPEYEEDGSPKIDLIVGRRPVDEKEDAVEESDEDNNAHDASDVEDFDEEASPKSRKTRNQKQKTNAKKGSPQKNAADAGPIDYEYLVKYKGRSYLHLDWKSGADLESMNKSAKGIYRRYLKKVAVGLEEDIESPEFDASYILPEKIVDEADQEITVEFSDKELLRWEKQREKELAEEDDDDESKSLKDAAETMSEDKPAKTESKDEVKEGGHTGKSWDAVVGIDCDLHLAAF